MRHNHAIFGGVLAGLLVLAQGPQAAAAKPAAETAAPVSAKPDLAAAKRHYADGEKKFKTGDFSGALVEFEAANEIKAAPQAERYIGLCHDSLGHLPEAAAWYEKFLAHVPEKVAVQGDEIRKRDSEIRAMPGRVHIESNPPGASVTIDGVAQPTPTPLDAKVSSGAHNLRFAEVGRLPAEKQIDVAFASAQSVSADLEVEPPPAPAPPPPAPVVIAEPPAAPVAPVQPAAEPRSRVPAYVTGGLAIAAAGVGAAFGILALNDKSDFDSNPTTKTADDGDTHALIADMAFGVALTFGVTSAVLFFTKDEVASPPATAKAEPVRKKTVTITPTPWIGSRSGGAGFLVQF